MLSIAQEPPRQDEIVGLLQEADARTAALYPVESRHGLNIEVLETQGVVFFVARLGGRAVGCGGYLLDKNGTAEVKRNFVTATARGHGVGRLILEAVEDSARRDGVALLQLETGVKSEEALGLYRRFGYRERGPFGNYQPDALSVFMEKPLAEPDAQVG